MKVGDLVRPRWIHRMVGLIREVHHLPHRTSPLKVYVQWQTVDQSHGNRWFDESELVVINEAK